MNKTRQTLLSLALAGAVTALAGAAWLHFKHPEAPTGATAQPGDAGHDLLSDWRKVLEAHRKIIVLLAEDQKLQAVEREAVNRAGHAIFHENRERVARMERSMDEELSPQKLAQLGGVLDYVESGSGLLDADRLAFRELLGTLQSSLSRASSLPAIKMHKRVGEDLEALAEIERNYEKEMRQIFSRFDARAIDLKRERWNDYVASLRKLYSRDQVLKDYGVIVPYPEPPAPPPGVGSNKAAEIWGQALPPKTVALTFDDGPHPVFSEEVAAILRQYGVPAVFFEVGRNIGVMDKEGKPVPGRGAAVSRKLREAGHVLANHSFTHAQLSREAGDALQREVRDTDAMLKAVDPQRSVLFRFPYGARSKEGLQALADAQLRSVMWNVDSLDWADPVPSSIADRVVRTVEQEGRGIILFHDIHERTVKALPLVLDRLLAQGYQFAAWDGNAFVTARAASGAQAAANKPATEAGMLAGYGNSWAVVIGVDQYAKWPRLQYAVRDATSVAQALVDKFGFASERVISLTNAQATRSAILAAFNSGLAAAGVKKNDRIFVFFAGHGATRRLSSGRDLGYIVPVDSEPDQVASDGIAMTEIQNIAEGLTARHVLFVMDACYSGLGLTRGVASGNYLRDNARRTGRQMLTAGGADQLVADGGPNGHSVFTWALLQGLAGKADLNGDGIITATELAAYVAPAVASVSAQTPAFGSLPGSEGGDFVFELPVENEFLSAQTGQLSGEAIALNKRLDGARPQSVKPAEPVASGAAPNPPAAAVVTIKDLQGQDQKIVPLAPASATPRQLAQHANDSGLQFYREKRYAEAETQFTQALKYRPDFALAANNLGFVYFRQDKFAESARWFENTLKMDPSRSVAYLNLGDAHARMGDNDKARKAYQTYLELSPAGSGAATVRAQLEKLGR